MASRKPFGKTATQDKPARATIVDKYIDTPEGIDGPEKIHILLDSRTMKIAGQYQDALFVARGVPFNLATVSISDPLALLIASQNPKLKGNDVVRQAQAWYEQWQQAAEQDSWALALLADNKLTNEPTPYVDDDDPIPGLPFIPEPKRDLDNPVEYRLKQVMDLADSTIEFSQQFYSAINEAFTEAIRFAGETDAAGFQSGAANGAVSARNESARTGV